MKKLLIEIYALIFCIVSKVKQCLKRKTELQKPKTIINVTNEKRVIISVNEQFKKRLRVNSAKVLDHKYNILK